MDTEKINDLSKIKLAHEEQSRYHLLQDLHSSTPYLLKYRREGSVDIYRFNNLDFDQLFLIGMMEKIYPFSVFNKTFYSWQFIDGKRAVYKKNFSL